MVSFSGRRSRTWRYQLARSYSKWANLNVANTKADLTAVRIRVCSEECPRTYLGNVRQERLCIYFSR
jgi:hypothetical protein